MSLHTYTSTQHIHICVLRIHVRAPTQQYLVEKIRERVRKSKQIKHSRRSYSIAVQKAMQCASGDDCIGDSVGRFSNGLGKIYYCRECWENMKDINHPVCRALKYPRRDVANHARQADNLAEASASVAALASPAPEEQDANAEEAAGFAGSAEAPTAASDSEASSASSRKYDIEREAYLLDNWQWEVRSDTGWEDFIPYNAKGKVKKFEGMGRFNFASLRARRKCAQPVSTPKQLVPKPI